LHLSAGIPHKHSVLYSTGTGRYAGLRTRKIRIFGLSVFCNRRLYDAVVSHRQTSHAKPRVVRRNNCSSYRLTAICLRTGRAAAGNRNNCLQACLRMNKHRYLPGTVCNCSGIWPGYTVKKAGSVFTPAILFFCFFYAAFCLLFKQFVNKSGNKFFSVSAVISYFLYSRRRYI